MSDSLWSILRWGLFGSSCTLYFDGSHNNQANKAGAGCIIKDNQGELVVAAAFNLTESFPDCDVAIAEAVALLNGLKLARLYNVNLSLIKGDSKEVIDHVLGCSRRPPRPFLSTILQQINEIINRFSTEIVHISREDNEAADKLATWGSARLHTGLEIFKTNADLPPPVAELVNTQRMLPRSSSREESEGEAKDGMDGFIGKAAAVAAGVGVLAWGVSQLFGESSSDQQEPNKSKAKALASSYFTTPNYASSTYHQNWRSNYYVLHFNGSDINQYDKGGAGCIIRNKQDLVVAAAYNLDNLNYYPKQFHVAIAAAVALRNGLNLAAKYGVKLHLIKGKNEEVINRVLGRQRRAPEVQYLTELIHEIKEALDEQSIDLHTQVMLIGEEEGNEVAHALANYGTNMLKFGSEMICSGEHALPAKVAQLLQQDKRMWSAENIFM